MKLPPQAPVAVPAAPGVLPSVDAITARIEQLAAQAKKPLTNSRTLAREYKSIHKKFGKREYMKACDGPAMCQNLLCDHRYSSSLRHSTPHNYSLDDKVLGLLMIKSEKDGYLVTKNYAARMLHANAGKLMMALAGIKADIDNRKFYFFL
jgi:hypothetical protein